MKNRFFRYLCVITVSASLISPAHAFDLSSWFNSWSQNSRRNALYVGAAATITAGLSFLAYMMCFKKKIKTVAENVSSEPTPVRPPSPMDQLKAGQRLIEAHIQQEVHAVMNDIIIGVEQREQQELRDDACAECERKRQAAILRAREAVSRWVADISEDNVRDVHGIVTLRRNYPRYTGEDSDYSRRIFSLTPDELDTAQTELDKRIDVLCEKERVIAQQKAAAKKAKVAEKR